MLDRDLAELYEVETKQLKRQVNRNIERFPEVFMFELTKANLKIGGVNLALPINQIRWVCAMPHMFLENMVF